MMFKGFVAAGGKKDRVIMGLGVDSAADFTESGAEIEVI